MDGRPSAGALRADSTSTFRTRSTLHCYCPMHRIHSLLMYPDDSQKDLSAVLSYMTGRTLSKEEIWRALELPRSTYYDQLEKGTLVTADNLRKAPTTPGINQVELLIRYRLIDPEEIRSLVEEIGGSQPFALPPPRT